MVRVTRGKVARAAVHRACRIAAFVEFAKGAEALGRGVLSLATAVSLLWITISVSLWGAIDPLLAALLQQLARLIKAIS